ncbi:MAG: hypothetical protein RJA07_1239 [Bacteroidota bacterium]
MEFEESAFRDSMSILDFKKHLSFDKQTMTFEYNRIYNNLEFEGTNYFRISNKGVDTLRIEISDERNLVNRDSLSLPYDDIQNVAPNEFTEIRIGVEDFSTIIKNGGKFRECFYLKTNDKNFKAFKIIYSGAVTLVKPTFEIESSKINLGKIAFGKTDTAVFKIKNVGSNFLAVGFDSYRETNSLDKNFQQLPLFPAMQKISDRFLKNGESMIVKIPVENYYGNSGKFERKLFLTINNYDSLQLTINATCIGTSFDSSITIINIDSSAEDIDSAAYRTAIAKTKTVYNYKKGCLQSIRRSTINKENGFFMYNDVFTRETIYKKCICVGANEYYNDKLEAVYKVKNNKYNEYQQVASHRRYY